MFVNNKVYFYVGCCVGCFFLFFKVVSNDISIMYNPELDVEEAIYPQIDQSNNTLNATETPTTTKTSRKQRTTPPRITFEENCDYLAHYCLKAYNTGQLCGRTLYYTYHTFKNYCLLDYVNCMERYEVWQVVHMGECFNITELTEYLLYPYDDDYFLDQYYVVEDH